MPVQDLDGHDKPTAIFRLLHMRVAVATSKQDQLELFNHIADHPSRAYAAHQSQY